MIGAVGPGVSAIVPALDEEARVGAAVASLKAAGADEVIVVDGGSRDRTVEVARRAGARVLEAPRGRASQLDAGARAAAGEILWFVHADALVPADARIGIEATLRDPAVVAGAFHIRTVAEGRGGWAARLLPIADLRSRYTSRPYGDQAVFVRAQVFWEVGGFGDARILEDLDLATRLWRRGRIVVLPLVVEVSGRRFLRQPLRAAVAMNTFPTLWRLGVPTGLLERLYGNPR